MRGDLLMRSMSVQGMQHVKGHLEALDDDDYDDDDEF